MATLMACSASREAQPTGNIGGEWTVEEVEGSAIGAADVEETPFLGFSETDGNVYGNLSCNTLTGTYKADANTGRLKFGTLGSTMMLCANMDVEQRLLKALGQAARYEAKDGMLTLQSASGKTLLKLQKK